MPRDRIKLVPLVGVSRWRLGTEFCADFFGPRLWVIISC